MSAAALEAERETLAASWDAFWKKNEIPHRQREHAAQKAHWTCVFDPTRVFCSREHQLKVCIDAIVRAQSGTFEGCVFRKGGRYIIIFADRVYNATQDSGGKWTVGEEADER